MTPDSAEPPRRKIAVVVVHGVGDQNPADSANAIGDLLQDLDIDEDRERAAAPPQPCEHPEPDTSPRYDPFTSQRLRINVRPVVVWDDVAEGPRTPHGPFHAFVDSLPILKRTEATDKTADTEADNAAGKPMRQTPPAEPAPAEDISLAFMRGQLRCYGGDPPEDTFDTIRLEGTRTADGGPARTVHIYELYWADLSRLKAGLLSIFTELYQLLFHLPSLGTHVIDAEASQHLTPAWNRFRKVQGAAAFALTMPIPVLNIFLLAVTGIVAATAAMYRYVPPHWQMIAGVAILGAVLTAWSGMLCWKAESLRPTSWIAPVLAWFVFAIGIAYFRQDVGAHARYFGHLAVQVVLVALAGALVDLTLRAYDERRPSAYAFGWIAGGIAIAAGLAGGAWRWPYGNVYSRILTGWIHVFEVTYLLLAIAWVASAALSMAAFVLGAIAVRDVSDDKTAALASQSVWTGRLMLCLPAAAFLSVTLAGWAIVSKAVAPLLGGLDYTPLIPVGTKTVNDLSATLLNNAGGIALPVILTATAIALLPAVWGLAPVAFAEVWAPELDRARSVDYSMRLGRWLTYAFGGLTLSGWLLVLAMTFAMPALGLYVFIVNILGATNHLAIPSLLTAVQTAGAASGLLFTWLFAIRGDLRQLALGFAPVLDILLDVDNWLREHPLSRNPRARICGRYVSLLRYICAWRDPATGDGYDAIVIVAHSQGTVITADLLRFLMIEQDPQLQRLHRPNNGKADLPILLFTMGCPLRQLYGRRFPRLYEWASHDDSAPMASWVPGDLAVPPRTSVDPDLDELGVEKWVNAYRSGDYVGRHLWRTDPCGYLWAPDDWSSQHGNGISMDPRGRLEFCIGAGAHTHYWDATARPIAWTLDELIASV